MTDPSSYPPDAVASAEELNPLLNPLLEHNLSRWAHVYFSTAPEKRDQAVRELLRELRSESAPPATPENRTAVPAEGHTPQSVACRSCGGTNFAGERFCGYCGAPLPDYTAPERARPQSTLQIDPAPAEEPVGETYSFLGLAPARPDADLQFLRERSSGRNYYEPESETHRGRVVVLALIVIVGIAGYVGWPYLREHVSLERSRALVQPSHPEAASPEPQAAEPSGSPTQMPASPEQTLPTQTQAAPTTSTPQNGPQQQAITSPQTIPAVPGPRGSGNSEEARAPAPPLTLASKAEPAPTPDNGTQELMAARRYLDGRGVSHNSAQAVTWLWKAVGKQNTQAEVLLANLYTTGDGVPKSCDQARLLLAAAAKKGSSDAAQKLRSLESNNCR